MCKLSLVRHWRVFAFGGLSLVPFLFLYWYFFSSGSFGSGPTASVAEIAAGQELFEHEWTSSDPLAHGDGLGPVYNARSCAACHFQGGLGGGGALEHNVLNYELFRSDSFVRGTIHNFSVDPAQLETEDTLRARFHTIESIFARTSPSDSSKTAKTTFGNFDPVHTFSIQPTSLFGAGWVDLISDRAIINNARNRKLNNWSSSLSSKIHDVPAGRVRKVAGRVGKFGWKNQTATLEAFVAAACANELGLGTPITEQARSFLAPEQSAPRDLDPEQFRSLVSFVKKLPRPVEILPDDPQQREAAIRGKELFHTIGCAICHVPNLGGVEGVYGDFLLYKLGDPSFANAYADPPPQLSEPVAQRPADEPRAEDWKTPALWGVADSAPYLHDGSAPDLPSAIQRHRGDAENVLKRYLALGTAQNAELFAFLGTLKAPPDARPARKPGPGVKQ
jgi:CxxC motif-containing protein (DUF1111 family)